MGWHWGILAASGAGAAGAYELIESVILSNSTTSTVTFSNINTYASTYKHLQLRMITRSTRPSFALDTINIRVNSDAGSTYKSHEMVGDGSTVSSTNTTPTGRILDFGTIASTTSSDIFATSLIDILDFANTSKNSTFRALDGRVGTTSRIALKSGLWINTAAITDLYIYLTNGPYFVAGSRFSLYGIKG